MDWVLAQTLTPCKKSKRKSRPSEEGSYELEELLEQLRLCLGIRPNPWITAELREYEKILGWDLCSYAVDQAALAGRTHWPYVRGVLRNLIARNITTREEAEGYVPTPEGYPVPTLETRSPSEKKGLSPWERMAIASALEEFDDYE